MNGRQRRPTQDSPNTAPQGSRTEGRDVWLPAPCMGGGWLYGDGEPTTPTAEPCEPARHPRTWDLLWGTPRQAGLCCCGCVLITVLVLVPLLLVVFGPSIVETFFNAATLHVLNITLADPTASRLYVETYAEVWLSHGYNALLPPRKAPICSEATQRSALPSVFFRPIVASMDDKPCTRVPRLAVCCSVIVFTPCSHPLHTFAPTPALSVLACLCALFCCAGPTVQFRLFTAPSPLTDTQRRPRLR